MGTYTVNINERTKTGKNLVALLRSLKGVVNMSKGTAIDESILDANTGNTQKAKNAKDLISKCLD
ncbi:MAG: hypothetical protein PF448_13640 [Bacteroidales bacterium]|nr:hypothetical protein [Bacteroidales bacterium]